MGASAEALLDTSTDLAFERSRLAAERTLIAWIRTALSMISQLLGIGALLSLYLGLGPF